MSPHTHKSPRGFLLLGPYADIQTTLTVELTEKWYHLYLIIPGHGVKELDAWALAAVAYGGETDWSDHVPNPHLVLRLADRAGFHVPPLAEELMFGRWERGR